LPALATGKSQAVLRREATTRQQSTFFKQQVSKQMESAESSRPLDEDRRVFLEQCRSMLAGLAIVGVTAPFLQACEREVILTPAGTKTFLVDVSALDTDGAFMVAEAPDLSQVLVVRQGRGSYLALSMTCTHEGCTLFEPEDQVMECPCHQSRFNMDGAVLNGPAPRPLRRLSAGLNPDGKLVVTL
jgi:nitrite reductase/ring-hydroxylating ferredoxin subunit